MHPIRELVARSMRRPLAFVPAFDVLEDERSYVFRADVPGVDPKTIDVRCEGGRVIVSGRRRPSDAHHGDKWLVLERTFGTFEREFLAPAAAGPDHMVATMDDGVLTITVEKAHLQRPIVQRDWSR